MANYFEDGADDEAAPSTAQGGEKEETEGKEDDGTSALLPKSILMGKEFKPGDEVVLKIDHIYDDEIQVSYATEKEEKEGETGPKKTTMEESESALDKMAVSPESGGY